MQDNGVIGHAMWVLLYWMAYEAQETRSGGRIVWSLVMACDAGAQSVNVWRGGAPGSENWTQKEKIAENTPVGTVVFNVVTPTLTACLPERSKARGSGVIIAPGGICGAGHRPRRQ